MANFFVFLPLFPPSLPLSLLPHFREKSWKSANGSGGREEGSGRGRRRREGGGGADDDGLKKRRRRRRKVFLAGEWREREEKRVSSSSSSFPPFPRRRRERGLLKLPPGNFKNIFQGKEVEEERGGRDFHQERRRRRKRGRSEENKNLLLLLLLLLLLCPWVVAEVVGCWSLLPSPLSARKSPPPTRRPPCKERAPGCSGKASYIKRREEGGRFKRKPSSKMPERKGRKKEELFFEGINFGASGLKLFFHFASSFWVSFSSFPSSSSSSCFPIVSLVPPTPDV